MRLAYLGPPGTFGEQAALRYAPDATLVPCPSHSAVAAAVRAGTVDQGIIAVENSVEGSVSESIDALIHDTDVQVRAEVVIPIEQCLIVAPGRAAADVRVILSHSNALGQCRAYLERHYPDARVEPTLSTSGAVQEALARPDGAAIASARAAEVFGGAILARGIQDRATNQTRFQVIAAADAPPTGDDKTSLAFTTYHDRPGSLVAVLQELSARGINLTKIESRPSRDALGVYVFLVDLEGHRTDATVAGALTALQDKTQTLRVIGSYPRFRASAER
jgi:prephenate dehydratase